MYRLKKDEIRFTLCPLKNVSHPKVKHKAGVQNNIVDALSWRASLMLKLKDEIAKFEHLKDREANSWGILEAIMEDV